MGRTHKRRLFPGHCRAIRQHVEKLIPAQTSGGNNVSRFASGTARESDLAIIAAPNAE
jgi:hypothetical protein